MLYAVKGNKQLKIEQGEKDEYLKFGYDIAEVDGSGLKIIETSPAKTVAYSLYRELQGENAELKEKLKDLEKKLKKVGGE